MDKVELCERFGKDDGRTMPLQTVLGKIAEYGSELLCLVYIANCANIRFFAETPYPLVKADAAEISEDTSFVSLYRDCVQYGWCAMDGLVFMPEKVLESLLFEPVKLLPRRVEAGGEARGGWTWYVALFKSGEYAVVDDDGLLVWQPNGLSADSLGERIRTVAYSFDPK